MRRRPSAARKSQSPHRRTSVGLHPAGAEPPSGHQLAGTPHLHPALALPCQPPHERRVSRGEHGASPVSLPVECQSGGPSKRWLTVLELKQVAVPNSKSGLVGREGVEPPQLSRRFYNRWVSSELESGREGPSTNGYETVGPAPRADAIRI